MRSVHGSGQWPAHQFMPRARGHAGRRPDHHHRRAGTRNGAASAAAGVHRARCIPVWLLHARPDLFRGGPDRGRQGTDYRRNPRIDERQYLPLRRLSEYRGGHPGSDVRERSRKTRVVHAMNNFDYVRATSIADAVQHMRADGQAKFIAGGTNLVDLIKEHVERPSRVIDITRLPLNKVEETADGGLRIGALVPNSDLAYHPLIAARYPLLGGAILAGASPQLRNMA